MLEQVWRPLCVGERIEEEGSAQGTEGRRGL